MEGNGNQPGTIDFGDAEISFIDWTVEFCAYELEYSHFEPTKKVVTSPSLQQLKDFISEFLFYSKSAQKLKVNPHVITELDALGEPFLGSSIVELAFHENEAPMIILVLLDTGKIRIECMALDMCNWDLNLIPSELEILELLILFYQIPLGEPEIEPDTDGLSLLVDAEEFRSHLHSLE
jgi:hypothetical protein